MGFTLRSLLHNHCTLLWHVEIIKFSIFVFYMKGKKGFQHIFCHFPFQSGKCPYCSFLLFMKFWQWKLKQSISIYFTCRTGRSLCYLGVWVSSSTYTRNGSAFPSPYPQAVVSSLLPSVSGDRDLGVYAVSRT